MSGISKGCDELRTGEPPGQAADRGYVLLRLAGRIDGAATCALAGKIDELAKRGAVHFVLSCAGVASISCSGIAGLCLMHRGLSARRGSLALAGVRPRVLDVLRMVGVPAVLPVYDDEEDALAQVRRRSPGEGA